MPAIGVLDSGIGGLSVLREIHRLLPEHPTIYFADQCHLPYGPRPPEEIFDFVHNISRYLIDEGAHVLVIACNTASAASLLPLRREYLQIPIVGMEPAIKPAVEHTTSGVVGVLMTQATAKGPLYQRVLKRYAADVEVITQVAPELVMLAEHGTHNTREGRTVLRRYLQPMMDAGVDHIVLACTHFPFLSAAIQDIVGSEVMLIDPGPAIARQVKRIWPDGVQPGVSTQRYITSADPEHLRLSLKQLLGYSVDVRRVALFD